MSETRSRADLARELETVVSAVPGVVMLYPAQAAPVVAVVSLVSRVAGSEAPPLVVVSGEIQGVVSGGETSDGLTVAVTIGVSEAVSAAETSRAVYSAIEAHLASVAIVPVHSVNVLVGAII
ncbi:MAG: hypothetical protein EPO52_11310 [Herbiconiux sp.]|uniref:hypothetical protein n=1 Tax=Herbiconiux sp. TaxID=1871186 RepID=UPI001223F5EF|nr:hypothetical protein [Herbiconiux sp.]TAJ47651.1 MAG: hypothetical protein EPO52_11310 [Herbiconiux sp.]